MTWCELYRSIPKLDLKTQHHLVHVHLYMFSLPAGEHILHSGVKLAGLTSRAMDDPKLNGHS